MSLRTFLLPVSLPILALLAAGTCPQAKAADPCDLSGIPQEIQSKLEKDYPDWRPEKLDSLDNDDRWLWLKAHPHDCPGIAIGHFESKSELSYAFLLITKPGRQRLGFRVVAFSRIDPSVPFVAHLVMKWNIGSYDQGSDEVIATVPPGQYEEAEGPKRVRTNLDAILCETLEKGSAVYYWRNGRYHELITSD